MYTADYPRPALLLDKCLILLDNQSELIGCPLALEKSIALSPPQESSWRMFKRIVDQLEKTPTSLPTEHRNLSQVEAKKNIQICGHEGRSVLFCRECHKHGYFEITHTSECRTGQALSVTPRIVEEPSWKLSKNTQTR
jgi:hypothetical protein